MDRITSLFWRLRPLGRVETSIFAHEFFAELADRAEQEAHAHESTLADTMRYVDTAMTDERKHREALERAREMRVNQDAENTALGRTFTRGLRQGQRLLQALPLRDHHGAGPLQGPTRAPASADRLHRRQRPAAVSRGRRSGIPEGDR